MNRFLVIFFILYTTAIFSVSAREAGSSFPYLSEGTWEHFCDWKLTLTKNFDPENVHLGDTVYVESNSYLDFAAHYLPKIREKFVLITPRTDFSLPGYCPSILDSDNVAYWLLQNIDSEASERIIPLPIGFASDLYEWGNPDKYNQYIPISLSKEEKSIFVYVNFNVSTNPKDREPCWRYLSAQNFATLKVPAYFDDYINDLTKTVFVISPPGNGLDCHRTWEALLLGCYPVVKHSTLDPLFEDLPVVLINDWHEVTFEFLHNKYEEFKLKTWARDKLYAPYWFHKVKTLQKNLRD